MASATVEPPTIEAFETEIERVREAITAKFAVLKECLLAREAALLEDLDRISATHRRQREECRGKKGELEEIKNQNKSNLNYPEFRSMQQEFMKKIENTIRELERSLLRSSIHFDWNDEVLDEISRLGKVQFVNAYTLAPKVDYRHKLVPTIKKSRSGIFEGEFDEPRVICVDPSSGHLFISEKGNNRVQRFDRNGNYISTLRWPGGNLMKTPDGMAISGNEIYISQYDGHHVQIYSLLTEEFVGRIGRRGIGAGELEKPTGLGINRNNGCLYVCDRGNSRVQVFDQSSFKCMFGGENLDKPTDIKLSGNGIFVLDESSPCIHVFNYEHECLRSIITNGAGEQTIDPFSFCFDMDENIYLTDFKKNCVSIFDQFGVLLHKIGSQSSDALFQPCGIAIDILGRVIVVDRRTFGSLRFF